MADSNRHTTWRQGDIFTLARDERPPVIGIIASHDCDICANDDAEPYIEFLAIETVADISGQYSNAKHPRLLQCEAHTHDQQVHAIQMGIHDRQHVSKKLFFAVATPDARSLPKKDRVVFRQWLAARYNRSAFPNAFECRLNSKICERIDKLSQKLGRYIRGLYFDLDDGAINERADGEVYTLVIWVVHETDMPDPSVANDFAEQLEDIFRKVFFDERNGWTAIEVTGCTAISTTDFPLELANNTKPWRLDHRSYASLPEAVFPDPTR